MSLTNCRWISPESYSLVIPPLLSPIFQLTPRPPTNLSPPPAINNAFLKGGRRRGWEAEGAAVITINQTTDAHFFFSPPTQRTMMPPSQMLFTFHGTPTPPQNIPTRWQSRFPRYLKRTCGEKSQGNLNLKRGDRSTNPPFSRHISWAYFASCDGWEPNDLSRRSWNFDIGSTFRNYNSSLNW